MTMAEDVMRRRDRLADRARRSAPRGRAPPRAPDWVLPKGKLEAGESAEAAALREVKEETGCDAVLGAFAGVIGYEVNGRP